MPSSTKKLSPRSTIHKKKISASPRTFVVVSAAGKEKGRYISRTPSGAAKKVGGRQLKAKNQKSATIRVRETTVGSKKKLYTYVVSLVSLPKRKVVMRDGKRITYQYKTVVKAKK